MPDLEIRRDDLSSAPTIDLVRSHLASMRAGSPEESCHALDVEALRDPSIRFWSAWVGTAIAGVGAWKDLSESQGELKSMRVSDDFLGRGVGRAILRRLTGDARDHGIDTLWLETGSGSDFTAARALYASEGFVECAPFGSYREDPHSVFMTASLTS